MTQAKERYAELLVLTKQYLLQEHALTDRILSDSHTYSYFRLYAQQQQESKRQISDTPLPLPPSLKKTVVPSTLIHDTPKQEMTAPIKQTPDQYSKASKPAITAQHNTASTPLPLTSPSVDKTPDSAKKNSSFILELPAALKTTDFSELKKIIQETLPHLSLLDKTPDDAEAKKIASTWAQKKSIPQVLILFFDETTTHLTFLKNIGTALEVHGITVNVSHALKLEQNAEWDTLLDSDDLKLVIASSSGFYNLPNLQKHYKEGTKQGRHYLGNRLLLLLSDISFYLKEPALKPSLWGALKELLTSPFINL